MCFCTHQADYSDAPYVKQNWESIYGTVKEAEPTNAPPFHQASVAAGIFFIQYASGFFLYINIV